MDKKISRKHCMSWKNPSFCRDNLSGKKIPVRHEAKIFFLTPEKKCLLIFLGWMDGP